jgi:ElaB/YqjD/DUF883 family membrane-anchored ribosome-binding protein
MSVEETEGQNRKAPHQAPYLGDAVRDLEERFAPRIEEAKEQLNLVNTRVKGFIRENPGTTLLCALGVGYLFGKLVSRK